MDVTAWIVVCALAQSGGDLRPLHDVQRDVSRLLKSEAQAAHPTERAAAVNALCQLHREMVADPRYPTSDALKQYRGQVWSRLTRVKASLKREFKTELASAASYRYIADLEGADALALAATESLASSLTVLDQSQNGPGRWAALGGGPVAPDWGPDLVELIERTINPAFWNVAGGPGTIVYYQPLQCLVVRATSEVLGKVGGLVGDLRGAGR